MTTGEHQDFHREGVVRLTVPTTSAPAPADRARTTLGIALGIVCPTAVPLRNGRIWLTGPRDLLPAWVVDGLRNQLSRRAADQVADDRLLAEAVAVLGAEIARARGQSPAQGATAALDRFLHVPDLNPAHRREARGMLRVALRSAATDSPEAAARLDAMSHLAKPTGSLTVVSAAQAISRDARVLGTTSPRSGEGRRRPEVGRSQRTRTLEIRGTGLVTGTASLPPDRLEQAALSVLGSMGEPELGTSLTARPVIDTQARQAVLSTTVTGVPQHLRVEILPTTGLAVAEGKLRSGTATDPHVLRISPSLAESQLRHVWTHQLSLMTQELAATQAGRPHGVFGRLRSLFNHERRDQRLRADHAAYQLLVKDWRQAEAEVLATGRTSGPRSVAELEQDLHGLAKTIRLHGGAMPTLPWSEGSLSVPAASELGVAAARAEAEATPARFTPGHLRNQVVTQLATLQAAATDLDAQAKAKTDSAAAATKEAGDKEIAAQGEEAGRDQGAPERARKLRVESVAASNKARRHTEIDGAYREAATDARQALAGYQALLNELDVNGPRIAELARKAADQVQVYEDSLERATPVKDQLATGVPTGKPLMMPTDDINRLLAAHDSKHRITSDGPIPMPGAEYRRLLSPDGLVFTVGGNADDDVTRMTQVQLRMKPRELTEVVDRDYELAEQMAGTLGEGGQNAASTHTHASNVTVGVNAQPFLAMAAPGTPMHLASQLLSPRVEVSRGRKFAKTAGMTGHHQSGWVDDNRGESLLYEWSGEWEIEVRNSPTEPWSPVETVDAGRQLTWVSSAYTVKPADETVSLAELGRASEISRDFPRHTLTNLRGVQGVADQLVAEARKRYGDIDRVTYDHISGLIVQDSQRLLREATEPGGITRRIPSGGETEYEITWEVEPVWADAKLIGESSSEMWQEEVLVDFAGVNASEVWGSSLTGTGSLAFPGKAVPGAPIPGYLPSPEALNDAFGTGVNLSPSVSAGRNVAREGGQNVSSTTITPAVHRNQGPTQAVLVDLKVTATLRKVGDRKRRPIVVRGDCQAQLRAPENDLLRAGGRADKNAVRRKPDGTERVDRHGRLLLRGDPEPPTGPQTLPPWNGQGPNQLRGVGKALPQNLTGADDAQRDALRKLSAMGLVPPLDRRLRPRRDKAPMDPVRRAAQLANYERIVQQISAPRIEAGINQACQSGLIVSLLDNRTGHAPHWRHFRLSVTQDFDDVQAAGTSTSENAVGLGISSRATGRTAGQSKAIPVSAGLGGKDGVHSWAGRLGIKFSRNALGRSFAWTLGRRVNRVTLNESTAPLDRLEQGVRIRFAEITDHGDSELTDVPGSLEVAYDSAHTRATAPAYEANPKVPDAQVVEQAIPIAVDAGNPADRIWTSVDAIRADSSALPQLHAFLSPESLAANREWMNGTYKLPMMTIRGPGNPLEALEDGTLLPQEYGVQVRGEATSLTFAAMSEQNTVDINFTMTDVGFTTGTSASGGVSVDGGAGVNVSGGANVGRTGGTSQSTTNGQTSGEERLLVNVGTHYEFIERHRMAADVVRNGRVISTVPLQDALVQKSLPERRALDLYAKRKLDLPVWVVADAAERYLNDKLVLNPRTAAGFIRRYKLEKAGATTGLAAEHTDEQLTAKVLAHSRVPASHAPTPAERLDTALNRTDDLTAVPRVVHMPPSHDASLASAQLESITVEGTDQRVDLRTLVHPQFDETAPGLRQDSNLLDAALDVDLSPDSYQGHFDDMFGPRGYEGPIEVPVKGQGRPDLYLVRAWARYDGDPIIDGTPLNPDGTPDIPKEDAGGIGQAYDYDQRDRSVGHSTAYSGAVNGGGTELSGGISTARARQQTAGSGEQNTTLDRLGHFDLAMVRRKVVFTTEVVRLRNAGAAAMGSTGWKLRGIDPADVITVSKRRELRADLVALVPRSEIADGPRPAQTVGVQVPEHRPVRLPESAAVEAVVPYGDGEPETDQLYDNLTGFLARPAALGRNGMAEYSPSIGAQLKPTALKAKFERLISPQGLELVPMAQPGNGRTTVAVTINARAVGWEYVGEVEGQEGKVRRHQEARRSSTSGTRLTPVTGTGGFDAGIASVNGSIGKQFQEQSSDGTGTRLETSKFEEGKLVLVRIPVVYDATVRTARDTGRGTPEAKETTNLRNVAKGQYFVKMLRHEYLDGLRQMESTNAVIEGARLQAVPDRLGRPDLTETEYDGSVYQPYRPLLKAIDKARTEKKPIVLSVREADGTERLYQAFPNGTIAGVNDGGFASAFATLHPHLALMAEGRVDLRKLYNTSSQEGSFSAKVAAELEKEGVPASVLKGLDYTTTARQVAAPTTGGTHTQLTAGRTIAPSGHGPSLSGP